MKRTYKYRLYPNKEQVERLSSTLEACRQIYNCGLTQRRWYYRETSKSLTYTRQAEEMAEASRENPELAQVHSQVRQDTLRRLDKAFSAFFRRMKRGEKSGFPRYKGRNRYHSFTYPQSGFRLKGEKKLFLSKIGTVRIRKHRDIPSEATIKTLTIKKEGDRWYVCFTLELPDVPKKQVFYSPVGIDVGILNLAALSDGTTQKAPGHYRRQEKRLAKEQRSLSRKKRGSFNRSKQARKVAKIHHKIARKRRDFLHKLSRKIVDKHDLIIVEDLKIKNMIKNKHLAKSIADASWGTLISMLSYKAEEAGGRVLKVDPRHTSQVCSRCGAMVEKSLSMRIHNCPHCSLIIDRDINAAINILGSGTGLTARGGWRVAAACEAGSPLL